MENFKKNIVQREKSIKKTFKTIKSYGISMIPADSNSAIKKVEKKLKIKLQGDLKYFYSTCDGYTFAWKCDLDNYQIEGQSSIRPLSLLNSLEIGGGKSLVFSQINNHNLSFPLDRLKIFDLLDGSGNYVLIDLYDNNTLYLFTYQEKINKLNLSVQDYIEKTIDFFGLELWQQFYIDDPSAISDYYLFDLRYLLFLKELLDEENYQYVNNKINKLHRKSIINSPSIKYSDSLSKQIEKLKKYNEYGSVKINLNKNASLNYMMKAQQSLGTKLPNEFINFYLYTNGLGLEWNIYDVNGKLNFLQFEEIFGGSKNSISSMNWNKTDHYQDVIWSGEEDEEYIKIARKIRPIELFEGDSGFVGFIINKQNELELYYSYSRGEIMKLPISFHKYISLSISLLGIDGWHEYYRYGDNAFIGEDKLVDNIRKVFPDFNLMDFRE